MLIFLIFLLIFNFFTIMNKSEFEAIMLYSELTFGNRDISVAECLKCIEDDARDLGLTKTQYIDYIISNGKLPK